MLGLGNSITSATKTQSVIDLASKVLHISGHNVTSSTIGGELLVSAMENLAAGSTITVRQSTDANKPVHNTNNTVTFGFKSSGSAVPVLSLDSNITLTDGFTIVAAMQVASPGQQSQEVSNIVGSNVDANNHSHLFVAGEDGESNTRFELRADSSASGSNLSDSASAALGEGNEIFNPHKFFLTKSAGASATVKMFSIFQDSFAEEGSSTDFDEDIDFVIAQIGGHMGGASAGSNALQGNMTLYELLVYSEVLSENQIKEIGNYISAKHPSI